MLQAQKTIQELEAELGYELKVNDLKLIIVKQQLYGQEKRSLTTCLENILGLETGRLTEIIYENILKQSNFGTLPRKIETLLEDETILQQYRKHPNLVSFQKITLQMLSHLYETKITLYSLNPQGILTGLIINEKGYQQNLKIARINQNFYEIRDGQFSYSSSKNFGLTFSNSNSSKFFEPFQQEGNLIHLNKKEYENSKSMSQIPLINKSMSNIEHPNSIINHQIASQKALDQLSIDKYHHSIDPEPINDQYLQNTNMYYYNQYPQQMYYQHGYNIYNENRSQGFINGYSNLPHNNPPMSPGRLSNSRRQNNSRQMEIDENEKYTGRLKFFDDAKNYGFIIMDADQSDIFVHCDDLQKAGISKDRVKSYKQSEQILRFQFKVMSYVGKYKESRKAVQLMIIDNSTPIKPYQ